MERKRIGDRKGIPTLSHPDRSGYGILLSCASLCIVLISSLVLPVTANAVELSQSVFRIYSPSSTLTPGGALASTDSTAVLPSIATRFRIRIGLTNPSTTSPLRLTQISAGGYDHMCAMAINGKAYCWGRNTDGQLGDGTLNNSATPLEIPAVGSLAGKAIISITAGYKHTCAITNDNQAHCWGDNAEGQLGNNSRTDSFEPVAVVNTGVLAGKTIKYISTGVLNTCAIASDDLVYCWGNNTNGQLGNGSITRSTVPVAVSTGSSSALNGKTVKAMTSSNRHTCVIANDDYAYCWGQGLNGRLGNNSLTDSTLPVAVSTTAPSGLNGKTVKSISAGGTHTCAVASDDKAYCWGAGDRGQLGDGADADNPIPVAVSTAGVLSGLNIIRVSLGNSYSCSVGDNGRAYCWGNGGFGQLGNNVLGDSIVPSAAVHTGVLSGKNIVNMSTGLASMCTIADNDLAYCWGNGQYGQMADGTFTSPNSTPVAAHGAGAWAVYPVTVDGSGLQLQLEYAAKVGYGMCTAIPNISWNPVTIISPISYDDSAPNDTATISSSAEDPTVPAISSGFSYQNIVRGTTAASHVFTNNNTLTAGQTGLWDFVLRDRTAYSNRDYCLRLVVDPGSSSSHTIGTYSVYPEMTTATGSLGVRFIDEENNPLIDPTISFTSIIPLSTSQASTATMLDNSMRRLEISNSSSSNGWSVALAPTEGSSATWQSENESYLYNGTNETGQLSIDTSSSSFEANGMTPSGEACGTTGLSIGPMTSYSGALSSITLATGSSESGFNCHFILSSVNLSQSIPANQAGGTYTLPMTVTITAQ